MGLLETGRVDAPPASRVDPDSLDPDSAEWLGALVGTDSERQSAQVRLHARLLRIARSEVHRRSSHLRVGGPELDDMAHQAAADAMVAITAKLGQFRGESRFTTWAYKFVIFEVSTKIGRHFWRNPTVAMDAEDWDRLPDRFDLDPARDVGVARPGRRPSSGGGRGVDRSSAGDLRRHRPQRRSSRRPGRRARHEPKRHLQDALRRPT